MKKQKKWGILILGTICFLGIIIYAAWIFEKESIDIYNHNKLMELKKTAELNAKDIQKDYAGKIKALTVLANNIAKMGEENFENVYSGVKALSEFSFFDYVGISDQEGNAIDSVGNRVNISERKYFQEIMNGKSASISDVLVSSVIDGDDVQIMAVPIVKDGLSIGIVYGVHNIRTISETLENTMGNFISTEIVDSNGKPVTILEPSKWLDGYSNVWDFYTQCKFIDGNVEQIRKNVKDLKSGYYTLKYKNEKRVTYYTPLEIEGYYIYSNLGMSQMEETSSKIKTLTFEMSMKVALALGIFITAIYLFTKKASYELRQSYNEAISNEKIMQVAVVNSNAFIFEYNSENKILKRKAGEKHIIFPDIITNNVPNVLLDKGIIKTEFADAFLDAFEQIKYKESVSVVVQTMPKYHSLWFEFSMKNIYDRKHQIINTIGSIKNITDIKMQEELRMEAEKGQKNFKNKAERDALTGLYNGMTAAEKIDKILKLSQDETKKHILVFMDLDNFKTVNDTFGHQYGNQVLVEIANIFSNKFRNDDIVGRFGGDEFFAFLLNTQGFEKMEHVFQELVEDCDKEYEKDGRKVRVSASFGIAIAPDHGSTFQELSQKADEMLFEVKRNKKRGYKLYKE